MNQRLRRFFIGGSEEGGPRRPHFMRLFALILMVLLMLCLFFGIRLYKKHQADKAMEERNKMMQQQELQFQREEQQRNRQQPKQAPLPLPQQKNQLPQSGVPGQNPAVNQQPQQIQGGAPTPPRVQAAPPPMIHPDRPR